MCILPMSSQKQIFEEWILEIDCWLRKFDHWPISEVVGLATAMWGMSGKTKDRDAVDLIFRKLSSQKRERVIRKWLRVKTLVRLIRNGYLGYPNCIFRNKRAILTDIRQKISDLDRAAPEVLGDGYRTPEGL